MSRIEVRGISLRKRPNLSSTIYNRALYIKYIGKPSYKKFLQFINGHIIFHKERIGRRVKEFTYNPIYQKDKVFIVPYYLLHGIKAVAKEYGIKMDIKLQLQRDITEFEYGFKTVIWENKLNLIEIVYEQIIKQGGATLSLNTGEGKTVILSKLIDLIGSGKVIIFAVNKTIQDQLYGDLRQHLGEVPITMIGGSGSAESKQNLEKGIIKTPITICVARTATKLTENDFDWGIFDFSIFDECHSYCAKGTSKIMLKCTTRYKLSLSASVDHNWNWPLIIYSSGNLIDGNRILGSSVKRLKGVVKVINYHGPKEYTRKITNFYGDTQVSKMVELFSKDEQRCKMVIDEIGKLIPNHEGIMVIAVSNCMLQVLRDLVEKTYPEVKLGTINQLVSDEEKEYAKKEAQIIFITYMSGTIAVNIPRTTAIVFASSFVNNGIQISGRALRKDYKPDKVREFIDIVDYDAANFKHQLSKRLKVWRERGFEIKSENYPSE